MATSAKNSLIAAWLLAVIGILLWYRNIQFDRIMGCFIFLVGLVELVEYGIHSGVCSAQAGKALYVLLWMQCLALAIGTYVTLKSTISMYMLIAYASVFIIVVCICLFGMSKWYTFDAHVGPEGYSIWSRSRKDGKGTEAKRTGLLGSWTWLYIAGIILPLVLLLVTPSSGGPGSVNTDRTGILLVLVYLVFSAVFVNMFFDKQYFLSVWVYTFVGLAFLVWMVGMFK